MAQYLVPGYGWFDDSAQGQQCLVPGYDWIDVSPSSFSVSDTEAATATDTPAVSSLTWTAADTEAATATDAPSLPSLTWSKSAAEAATATDAPSASLTWAAATAEAATAADACASLLAWGATATEAATASSASTEGLTWTKAILASAAAGEASANADHSAVISAVATALDSAFVSSQAASITEAAVSVDAPRGSFIPAPVYHVSVLEAGRAVASVTTPKQIFEPLFPPDISLGAIGGCGWRTRIVTTASGVEYRAGEWGLSLGHWVISKGLRTSEDMAQMMSLFAWAQGQRKTFRFKDWFDFTVTSAEGILMPFAEGAVGLGKRYTLLDIYGNPITVDRPIFRPVPDTVVFSPAGPGLDYTTGIVTAGTIGVTTWSGEFHIPVCFLSDKADIDITLTTDAAGWKGITLQEVRE